MDYVISFEDIKRANAQIKTTKIKDKEYAEVNQRIKAFRMVYPKGGIVTHILSNEAENGKNHVCIMRAIVTDENGKELGTGTAYENEGNSFINKTSYIENCETSAVGRALGMAGFGIDTSVCSAEELQNALLNQKSENRAPKQSTDDLQKKGPNDRISEGGVDYLEGLIRETGSDVATLLDYYKVGSFADLTVKQFEHCTNILEKRLKEQRQ